MHWEPLSARHRLGYTASTLNIRKVALPEPASCSGLSQWHALRSVITPAAIEMEYGGKGCFSGHDVGIPAAANCS